MPVEFDEQRPFDSAYGASSTSSGILGFLIRKEIVKDERQANAVLVLISCIALVAAALLFWHVVSLTTRVANENVQAPVPPSGMTLSSIFLNHGQ